MALPRSERKTGRGFTAGQYFVNRWAQLLLGWAGRLMRMIDAQDNWLSVCRSINRWRGQLRSDIEERDYVLQFIGRQIYTRIFGGNGWGVLC